MPVQLLKISSLCLTLILSFFFSYSESVHAQNQYIWLEGERPANPQMPTYVQFVYSGCSNSKAFWFNYFMSTEGDRINIANFFEFHDYISLPYEFFVETEGDYNLWAVIWSSSYGNNFKWVIDNGVENNNSPVFTGPAYYPNNLLKWRKYGTVHFTPGKHTVEFRIHNQGTEASANRYHFVLDCLMLANNNWIPTVGASTNGIYPKPNLPPIQTFCARRIDTQKVLLTWPLSLVANTKYVIKRSLVGPILSLADWANADMVTDTSHDTDVSYVDENAPMGGNYYYSIRVLTGCNDGELQASDQSIDLVSNSPFVDDNVMPLEEAAYVIFDFGTSDANLIPSAGFDQGFVGNISSHNSGWTKTTGHQIFRDSVSATIFYLGTSFTQLPVDPIRTASVKPLKLKPDTVYSFSAWIKHAPSVNDPNNLFVRLTHSAGTLLELRHSTFDGQWHQVTGSFNSQEFADVRVIIESSPSSISGASYIDSLMLVEGVSLPDGFLPDNPAYEDYTVITMQNAAYNETMGFGFSDISSLREYTAPKGVPNVPFTFSNIYKDGMIGNAVNSFKVNVPDGRYIVCLFLGTIPEDFPDGGTPSAYTLRLNGKIINVSRWGDYMANHYKVYPVAATGNDGIKLDFLTTNWFMNGLAIFSETEGGIGKLYEVLNREGGRGKEGWEARKEFPYIGSGDPSLINPVFGFDYFIVDPFDIINYAAYPATSEKNIKMKAAQGTVATGGFCLRSRKNMHAELSLSGNLTGENTGNIIASSQVDLREIKDTPYPYENIFFVNKGERAEKIPDGVYLLKDRTAKLWIQARVMPGTIPDNYIGTIQVSEPGGAQLTIPVSLCVLPFNLPDTVLNKQISMYDNSVTENVQERYLDLKEHGMDGAAFWGTGCGQSYFLTDFQLAGDEVLVNMTNLEILVTAHNNAGLSAKKFAYPAFLKSVSQTLLHIQNETNIYTGNGGGTLRWIDPVRNIAKSALKQMAVKSIDHSWDVHFMIDEIDNNEYYRADAREYTAIFEAIETELTQQYGREIDIKTYANCQTTSSLQRRLPDLMPNDLDIYSGGYGFLNPARCAMIPPGKEIGLIMTMARDNSCNSRFVSGVYFWQQPSAYFDIYGNASTSTHEDMYDPQAGSVKSGSMWPTVLAEEERHGFIPAVGYEGIREGAYDLRYLAKFYELVNAKGDRYGAQALIEAELNSIQHPAPSLQTWSNQKLAGFRNLLVNSILNLMAYDPQAIIPNGGFDAGDKTGWLDANSVFAVTDGTAYEGAGALTVSGSGDADDVLISENPLILENGKDYALSFWIKHTIDVENADHMYIVVKDNAGNVIETAKSCIFDSRWHQVSITFKYTTPVTLAIVRGAGTSGTSYIDAIKINEIAYDWLNTASYQRLDPEAAANTKVVCLPMDEGEGDETIDSSTNSFVFNLSPVMDDNNWITGNNGFAVSFNGTNNYLKSIKNIPQTPDFTYELWFKAKEEKSGCQDLLSTCYKSLYIYGSNLYFQFWTSAGNEIIAKGNCIKFGEWQHVAVSYDHVSQRMRMYLDGTLAVEKVVNNPPVNTSYPVTIGASYSYAAGFKNFFKGAVDEVKILNTCVFAANTRLLLHLEGNPIDCSTYNNILNPWGTPAYAPSPFGSGLVMNGIDQNIRTVQSISQTPDFTYELWFKAEETNGFHFLLSTCYKSLYIYGNNLYFQFWTSAGNEIIAKGNCIRFGKWQHVAVGYDHVSRTMRMYLDGVLAVEKVVKNPPSNVSYPVTIGSSYSGSYYCCFFKGAIDEVRILDVSYPAGNETLRYNFNNCGNNTLKDYSQNNNMGIARNISPENWQPGLLGGCLSFDGIDDYIMTKDPVSFNESDVTIQFYFKVKSPSNKLQRIIMAFPFSIGIYAGSDTMFFGYCGNTSGEFLNTMTHAIKWDTWQCFTMTFDYKARLLRGYLDGQFIAEKYSSVVPQKGSLPVFIGALRGGGVVGDFFAGMIDELIIIKSKSYYQ